MRGLAVAYYGAVEEISPDRDARPAMTLTAVRLSASLNEDGTRVDDDGHDRLATLKEELAAARSASLKANETATALAAALKVAEGRAAALQQELRDAQSEVVRANTAASGYRAELQALTLQCRTQAALLRQRLIATARLHRELVRALDQRVGAYQDNIRADAERIRYEQELLSVNLAKSHIEQEMQAILQSKIWRLTAPLRSAVARSRRRIASLRRRIRSADR